MSKLIPVVLSVCLMAVGACDNRVESKFVPPPIPSTMFANLSAGEEIVAELFSSGCFHHSRHRFEFEISDVVQVAITEIVAPWPEIFLLEERVFLGSIELTGADLERLDNLVNYYRNLSDGVHCTSVDGITFKLSRGGELVEESNYTDGTCSNSGPDVLTLWALVARVTDSARDIIE